MTATRSSTTASARLSSRIPYMLIVGARESQDGTVSLRRRTDGDAGVVAVEGFLAGLAAEISSRSVTLTVGRS